MKAASPSRTAFAVLLVAAALGACGRRDAAPRTYTENAPPAPMPAEAATPEAPEAVASAGPEAAPPAMPPLPAGLGWTCPPGWDERPGAGMRRAVFVARSGTNEYECGITVLSGAAGGLPANVLRWAGQIGVDVNSPKLRTFIDDLPSGRTEFGEPVTIVDFTRCDAAAGAEQPLMLAAMMRRAGDCVFVKLVAPRAVLEAERGRFEALCRSLRTR